MDLQTNLAMMENTEFEEKVDIDDLVQGLLDLDGRNSQKYLHQT